MENSVKCPHCESRQIYKSRSGSRRLPFPIGMFLVSSRCYGCYSRFLARGRLLGGSVRAK